MTRKVGYPHINFDLLFDAVESRPEYEQRHILTLRPVSQWNARDAQLQLEHNRILQKGYSELDPIDLVALAALTKEDWLTDFVCPKPGIALKLNIAADLITTFQVSAEDLQQEVDKIYTHLVQSHPNILFDIKEAITQKMKTVEVKTLITTAALNNMQKKFPHTEEESLTYQKEKKEIFIALEEQRQKKKITHEMIMARLKTLMPTVAQALDLQYKTLHPRSENEDFSFLGAAGSGKSTIAKEFLKEEDKLNCVILATDDYRGVSFNPKHEKKPTDQVFIKTQDTAYSIKELVQQRLERATKRPNIILDCVSLEGWHRRLLHQNKSTVSAVACLNDLSLVPIRAYKRATDPHSGVADRGRQVNTSALLKAHAEGSSRLLVGIPHQVQTMLYDTNIPRGAKAPVMAVVDTRQGKQQIEIYHLAKLSKFLGKANANIEAGFTGELYRDESKKMYRFTFDEHYQAEQILNLVKPFPPFKSDPYHLLLKTEEQGAPYAEISFEDNQIQLKVFDSVALIKLLNRNDQTAKVFKSMVMQIYGHSLEEARKNMRELGKNNAQYIAIEKIIPTIERLPASLRRHRQEFTEKMINSTNLFKENTPQTQALDLFVKQRKQLAGEKKDLSAEIKTNDLKNKMGK